MTRFSYKTLRRHKQASSRSFANEEQPRAVALVQWDVIMPESRVAPRFRLRSNRRHKRASSTACRGRAVLIEHPYSRLPTTGSIHSTDSSSHHSAGPTPFPAPSGLLSSLSLSATDCLAQSCLRHSPPIPYQNATSSHQTPQRRLRPLVGAPRLAGQAQNADASPPTLTPTPPHPHRRLHRPLHLRLGRTHKQRLPCTTSAFLERSPPRLHLQRRERVVPQGPRGVGLEQPQPRTVHLVQLKMTEMEKTKCCPPWPTMTTRPSCPGWPSPRLT